MALSRRDLGQAAEEAACGFLRAHGYRILSRNYVSPCGEIDIICRHQDCIVFVEVKSLSYGIAADPEDHINSTKQQRLRRAANAWLSAHRQPEMACRFDAISVLMPKDGAPTIRHFEDAFPG